MGGAVDILLVEGHKALDASLAPALTRLWSVQVAHTGGEALTHLPRWQPRLIIFDASTMRSNGVRSCRRLRQAGANTPLLYVHTGPAPAPALADVCLAKPFTPRKLTNRVRALLPAQAAAEQIVRFGHLTLNLGKRSIEVVGKGECQLTPKLLHLFKLFFRHPNQVISRQRLMQEVWQTSYMGDTRTLDVHVRWAREIIEEQPTKPILLRTVRGQGYLLQMCGPNPKTT